MAPHDDFDSFLMGGGGAPYIPFKTIGESVTGTVVKRELVQQRDLDQKLKFWEDGNPMMQAVVTLQTRQFDPSLNNDDGQRRLFIKGQMQSAVRTAVEAAGATTVEIGGTLTVTYVGDGVQEKKGYNAPKQFTASYVRAPEAFDTFVNGGTAAAVPNDSRPTGQGAYLNGGLSAQGSITTTAAPTPAAPQVAANPLAQFSPEQLAAMQAAGVDISKLVGV